MSTRRYFALLLILGVAGGCEDNTAPNAYPEAREAKFAASGDFYHYFGGHRYQIIESQVSWHDAVTACSSVGAHLVTINSAGENDFIWDLVGNQWSWLGGTDEESEGNWHWVTNEPFNYTNWALGEPNNCGPSPSGGCGPEHYLGYWGGLQPKLWNDLPIDVRPPRFACEWEIELDIKPGSDPNSINCNNPDGVISVAILTTDGFDATTVDHTTVTFEGAGETHVDKKTGEARRHEEDIDYDGDIDLVFHFRNGDTGLICSSTDGTLTGQTIDGVPIESTDAVRMIRMGDCWPPPSGLVSWWPGDGNSTDIVGGNDGTLENGAAFAPGMVGQAFSLDGADDYVSVPDRSDWTLGDGPFTIDLWVNFDEVRWRSPFVDHNEGGGETNKWIFWYDDLGHRDPSGPALRFHINSPSLGPLDPVVYPWVPSTGQWYHVAVTRTGSSYSLYIDGVLAITETDESTIPDAEVQLSIGQSEYQYFFDGLIDEVEIFNRALSTEEVREIYEAGSAGKCKD